MLEDNRNIRSVRYCTFSISCYIHICTYICVYIFSFGRMKVVSLRHCITLYRFAYRKRNIIVTVRILFDSRLTYFCEIF